MPQQSVTKIRLKLAYLKFHSNFPGANELIVWINQSSPLGSLHGNIAQLAYNMKYSCKFKYKFRCRHYFLHNAATGMVSGQHCQLIEVEWRICVNKLNIIGSDNGSSPDRRQAIIRSNAGIVSIGPLGTNFSEILIEIHNFHSRKCMLKCRLENGGHFVSASMC